MSIIKQWPAFLLLLAIAIAPLFQGIQIGVLVAIYTLVLAVFIKVFLSSYQKFRIPYNSFSLLICLFYMWMALSISWSPAPSISLFVFFWLSIFPLCYFIYSFKQPNSWSYLAVGILFVTLIFALIGIWQSLFSPDEAPSSLFLTRNTYGAMLNLIALPATVYFISPRQVSYRSSILLGIILFILFFAGFQTGSKGATVSLCLGLIFIFVINWKYIEKFSFFKVVVILTTALLLANIQQKIFTEHSIINRLEQLSIGLEETSTSDRILMWQSAWQIIKNSPIVGTGIGTFFLVFPGVRHPQDRSAGNYLHNDYLQFWLETGFIGLSLMILLMVAISALFIRVLMQNNLMLRDRLDLSGFMAGLFCIALHSFADFNFYIIAILMIMGFMCARIQEISSHYISGLMREFVPANKLSRKIFILAAVVFSFVILSYGLPMAIGNFYYYKASEHLENGQIKNSQLTLERAAAWNPESVSIRFQQFSLHRNILQVIKSSDLLDERKTIFANALLLLNKIERINPLMGAVPENRGLLLMENSDIAVDDWEEQAILEFNKTLQLHPRLFRARIALAGLLEDRGELNEAALLMNDGIRYYYDGYLTGIDKFYQYAIELNIMNGDTIKAKEIQIEKGLLVVENQVHQY